ncbi:MAG: DUF3347 domain-containing protein [Bacteroidota bacterium]|nr:DUF3347 domain-containing protein [Bacteroidota bacterium]
MKFTNLCFAVLLAAGTITFAGCESEGHEDNRNDKTVAENADGDGYENTAEEKSDAMEEVFNQYEDLRNKLYNGNADAVKNQAEAMKKELDDLNTTEMAPAEVTEWNTWVTQVREPLNKIEAATAIEAQRTQFADLTTVVYNGVKKYGVDDEVYYQFCPMAMNNKGAYWLDTDKEIKNPYFGEGHSTCGSTKETLAAQKD